MRENISGRTIRFSVPRRESRRTAVRRFRKSAGRCLRTLPTARSAASPRTSATAAAVKAQRAVRFAAPPGYRSEIGTVGFHQQSIAGDDTYRVAQRAVGGIGHGAGQGNVPAAVQKRPGGVLVSAEAVPEQRPPGETLVVQHPQRIGKGVAGMYDHGAIQPRRDTQLKAENPFLHVCGGTPSSRNRGRFPPPRAGGRRAGNLLQWQAIPPQ